MKMKVSTLLIIAGLASASESASVVDCDWDDPTNWPAGVAKVLAHAAAQQNGKLQIAFPDESVYLPAGQVNIHHIQPDRGGVIPYS